MILQALHDLAIREDLIPDLDFQNMPVSWVIRIDKGGRYLGIVPNETPKSIPKRMPSRSGKHPPAEFFVDNPLYVLGVSIPKEKYELLVCKKRLRLFAAKIILCGIKTGDSAVRDVGYFLRRLNRNEFEIDIPATMKGNDLIAFSYLDDEFLVHERPVAVNYWRTLCDVDRTQKTNAICLVTGMNCIPAKKHKKLKNVPQKKVSDIALSPCNQAAFESYGWGKGENAEIATEISDLVMTALNRLLHPNYPDPKDTNRTLSCQNVKLSTDTIVCYWTRYKEELSDSFGLAIEVDEEKVQAKPEQVAAMYKSLWRGVPYQLAKPNDFYSLVLSGGQGRATVRDWIATNTQYVVESLAQYFDDLKIVRRCPESAKRKHPDNFPLSVLLESLSSSKKNRKDGVPAAIGAKFYRASIDKKLPFPQTAFFRAVGRYRAELGKENDEDKGWFIKNYNDARAAVIKAYLNRKNRRASENEEVNEKMNPTCMDKGYLLGQLMSVLEKLQNDALGDVNASIVDRYFAGASASPKSVFGSLLRNARHHAHKAKDEEKKRKAKGAKNKVWSVSKLERLIDQLSSQFDVLSYDSKNPRAVYENGFPTHLSLEQQGMFVLGYHQMRKWLWMKREEREAWNAEHEDAPRAYIWKGKSEETATTDKEQNNE